MRIDESHVIVEGHTEALVVATIMKDLNIGPEFEPPLPSKQVTVFGLLGRRVLDLCRQYKGVEEQEYRLRDSAKTEIFATYISTAVAPKGFLLPESKLSIKRYLRDSRMDGIHEFLSEQKSTRQLE